MQLFPNRCYYMFWKHLAYITDYGNSRQTAKTTDLFFVNFHGRLPIRGSVDSVKINGKLLIFREFSRQLTPCVIYTLAIVPSRRHPRRWCSSTVNNLFIYLCCFVYVFGFRSGSFEYYMALSVGDLFNSFAELEQLSDTTGI